MLNPLEYIMGVQEASKKWGLSPGTLKNMCADGRAKAKKIGKTWVLDATQPNPANKKEEEEKRKC